MYAIADDQDCLLRLRRCRAAYPVFLRNLVIRPGDDVLELHLWNDRIPVLPRGGADLGWAGRTGRLFAASLRTVADHLDSDPALRTSRAVCGTTILIRPEDASLCLMARLGFEVLPARHPLGRFSEFWENAYAWGLMWTYNPASLRGRSLLRLRRAGIWMARDEFLRRYRCPRPARAQKAPQPYESRRTLPTG